MADDTGENRVRMGIALRTRHAQYVEYIADRDGENFSYAISKIIFRARQNLIIDGPERIEKIRKHVMISESDWQFVNTLAKTWGLEQSDVMRRLIDDALARDTTV